MNVSVEPLLAIQRDLLSRPRGKERFEDYLDAMIVRDPSGRGQDARVPLALFNPMSKDHVRRLVDDLVAVEAENHLRDVARDARGRFPSDVAGLETKLALVVVDDALGGWTNRGHTELRALLERGGERKRGFTVVPVWTSEPVVSAARIRWDAFAALFRTQFFEREPAPATLAQILDRESRIADITGPRPESNESMLSDKCVAVAREIIRPFLNGADYPTYYKALFGDGAAIEVGYSALGLPTRAGFAVAQRRPR